MLSGQRLQPFFGFPALLPGARSSARTCSDASIMSLSSNSWTAEFAPFQPSEKHS
jgi:hypothetical protein